MYIFCIRLQINKHVCLSVCLWPQISVAALIFSSRLSSEPEAVIPRRTRKKYLQQNPEQEYKQWVALPPPGGVLDISLGGEVRPGPSYPDPV